ncbi:hypothetical protein [Desulfovibrio subterraneus]|uniref:DNA-binding protein n=1 Tax=Desulfovibrio subterraneus TaxID=2718620 RepID=A0A7J0BM98_9BACT|nr:hypothetical protein [Desulfovibrio subterraneus]GFM34857.1 hypothetical protein DSM101010T_32220 [Desulfovibrio subterraneus]
MSTLSFGPYFDLETAANFCGFKSGDAFRRAMKRNGIDLPTYGFTNRKYYARHDLEQLMQRNNTPAADYHLIAHPKPRKVVV